MTTPSRRVFVALVAMFVVLLAGACIPTSRPASAHFPSCTMPVHDVSAPASRSAIKPYLDEIAHFTGMRFTWVETAQKARYGLVIKPIPAGMPPGVGGTYRQTYRGVGQRGEEVVYGSVIELRAGVSAGVRRHELGHLFGLAHDPSSPLMRTVPSGSASYSAAQRAWMRDVARRSGCR